jgi:predicted HTH domain antitoxin
MGQTALTLDLPDSALKAINVSSKTLPEFIQHTLAVELYREGKLSLGKAKELAGLATKWEMIQLLNSRGVFINYQSEDAESDLANLDKVLS